MKPRISERKAIHPGHPPSPLVLRHPPWVVARLRLGWGSIRLSHSRRIRRPKSSILHPSRTSKVNRALPKDHRPNHNSNGPGPTARRPPSRTPRILACSKTRRSSRVARRRHLPAARRPARPRLPRHRLGLVRPRTKRPTQLSASVPQRLSRPLSVMALPRLRIQVRVHRRTSDRPRPPRILRLEQRIPAWAA